MGEESFIMWWQRDPVKGFVLHLSRGPALIRLQRTLVSIILDWGAQGKRYYTQVRDENLGHRR
jgi:hypothetical protein